MSDIMEKTLVSLQNLISGASGKDTACNRYGGFRNLVECIAAATTKREQDLVIQKELHVLQQKLGQAGLKPYLIRDCLIRAIYCEMLGYPASFVYIHAIKQAQQGSLLDKRIGYLAATIFLHDQHELVILLINNIQKDLRSTNILEICMALTAVTYLVSPEMIPVILDSVQEKLRHPKEMVRKKAVFAMHHFLKTCPEVVRPIVPQLKACIGDKDPDVVAAAIYFVYCLAQDDVDTCKDVIEPVLQVLNQVLNRKLPMDFDYHGLPGPWIQIQILKLLALLGHGDVRTSSKMYDTLKDVLLKVDVNHGIGYAVIYECLATIAYIQPDPTLLENALPVISKFLQSNNANMKYMGLKALTQIVQNVQSSLATRHQSVVMECLHHPDVSIRTKTLDLLFCLTNAANIQVVCPRMLEHVSSSTDEYAKTDIILRIVALIDRHSSSARWSLETLNALVISTTSGALPLITQSVKELLKKGSGDEKEDQDLRASAVDTYFNFLVQKDVLQLSRHVIQLAVTIISDYYELCTQISTDKIFELVSQMLKCYYQESDLLVSLLILLKKIAVSAGVPITADIKKSLQCCSESHHSTVRQQAFEISRVFDDVENIKALFKNNTSSDESGEISYDWTLNFLDAFIVDALTSGSSPYKPPSLRRRKEFVSDFKSLELPCQPSNTFWNASAPASQKGPPSLSSISTGSESVTLNSCHSFSIKLSLDNIKRVWNKQGCNFEDATNTDGSSTCFTHQFDGSVKNYENSVGTVSSISQSTKNDGDEYLAKALFGSPQGDQPFTQDFLRSPEASHKEVSEESRLSDALHANNDKANGTQRSTSSTSSIQRISSDSGPSSNLDSPLDTYLFLMKPDIKQHFLADPNNSLAVANAAQDDCSSETDTENSAYIKSNVNR